MRLNPGDTVALIAPASQLAAANQPLLPQAVALLQSWGLKVRVDVDASNHFYLAGSDASRAASLKAALEDPEVRGIFCTRGGYGSPRLLPSLSDVHAADAGAGKLFVGCSDLTALHLAFGQQWPAIRRLHGPELVTPNLLADTPEAAGNRQALHQALFNPDWQLDLGPEHGVEVLAAGPTADQAVTGKLEGGCLTLLCALMGTPWQIQPQGKVLFLEDVAEAPYRVDRMLTQLRLAGVFDQAKALVFGAMFRCTDNYNDLRAVILDCLQGLDLPIYFGIPSGHGPINLCLPLGATVSVTQGRLRLAAGCAAPVPAGIDRR